MSRPLVSLLTDYGLDDAFAGICHGVIAGICPDARIVDLTHAIPRHDIRAGAVILRDAVPFLPVGVHVAVVDPDVGAERRAVALAAGDGRLFVGPDNGLLWPAAQACGGVVESVEISHSPLRLEPVSATFHGRDIFAPVAAHLANGIQLADAGAPSDPAELVKLELPEARIEGGVLYARVLHVDRFGNVQLGAGHQHLEELRLRLGREVEIVLPNGASHSARYVRTFADAHLGELILYENGARSVAIAVNHHSAAQRLGVGDDDELRIGPA